MMINTLSYTIKTPHADWGDVWLQALWRGWYLRHRVLYSPHTEPLGRRYMLRTWQSDLENYVPN